MPSGLRRIRLAASADPARHASPTWVNGAMIDLADALVVADAAAWRAWLDANEDTSDGVWLALAKKGVVSPTSLRYDEALEEALCSGWIDGPKHSIDDAVFAQRFTPRRRGSLWSTRNVGIVAALIADGRMRRAARRRSTARRRTAAGTARTPDRPTAEVPEDLAAALAASEAARRGSRS